MGFIEELLGEMGGMNIVVDGERRTLDKIPATIPPPTKRHKSCGKRYNSLICFPIPKVDMFVDILLKWKDEDRLLAMENFWEKIMCVSKKMYFITEVGLMATPF